MVEESAPWDWDWLTAQGGYISLEPGYLGESILLGVFSKGLLKEKKGVVEGDARLYRQVAGLPAHTTPILVFTAWSNSSALFLQTIPLYFLTCNTLARKWFCF